MIEEIIRQTVREVLLTELAPILAEMRQPSKDLDRPLSLAELSKIYNRTPQTISRMRTDGRIPSELKGGVRVTTWRMLENYE